MSRRAVQRTNKKFSTKHTIYRRWIP